MSTARRALRWLARLVLELLAFALFFPPLWAAVVPERRPAPRRPVLPDTTRAWRVWVADWGYHTSIVVEQPPQWRFGPPGREAAPYLEWAWGDRRFYRDSDYRPHMVYATLFLPTASVTYLAGRDAPPSAAQGARGVWTREVDARTLQALVAELERDIRYDGGARRPPSPPVAGYEGRFYDAHGRYLWARDCNRWTVDRLAAAGLARGGAGVVFSGQVANRLQGFAPAGR